MIEQREYCWMMLCMKLFFLTECDTMIAGQ